MPVRIAAGHQLLWLAALSQLPLPPEVAGLRLVPLPAQAPSPYWPTASDRRWSTDGCVLWRRGGTGTGTGTASGGLVPASYGASQAGAVIRYRLAPSSAHRPAVYLRASSALRFPRDEEVAVGFAARPLA